MLRASAEEEVTVLNCWGLTGEAGAQKGGQIYRWELPRTLTSEEDSSEHVRHTHL